MNDSGLVRRQSGVALWRQIADRIRAAIADGSYDETGMVPPETVLAADFGVNRHTVRAALSALTQEGMLRPVQGVGTLILRRERLNFPISRRTRFTEGIGTQARELSGHVLDHAEEPASAVVAAALDVAPGTPVLRIESLRMADARAVSRSTAWYPLPRFRGIADVYARTGSVTAALKDFAVEDYVRVKTEISAVHAEPGDLSDLGLAPGAIVLVTAALNADPHGLPIQYAVSRFPADRVQFTVEG
ncbi:phosphonate metabolism transcriptional regulator PhnF [Rhizobiaceae bacterium BDR2-2]|uniref:Phosphonate metabolism transcriptional regulator PhnF n=1 Tax=Ectorhizobium quercum TaxID=2965071 RepID=A0AAE3MWK2_9HYPH|nr:phosphonate metabolism transcriptional regulator PhnF [Ectorhizobium quercum]MCX8995652.1 phosphonate metabolism transcriptional regulator PhnF [Ectorhizobium quercum]